MNKPHQSHLLYTSTSLLLFALLLPSYSVLAANTSPNPSSLIQFSATTASPSKTKQLNKVSKPTATKSSAKRSALPSPSDLSCSQAGFNYVGEWGTSGNGNSQFKTSQGIASDTDGNIYVADTLNHRVQKFSPTGLYITQWGGLGTTAGRFNKPTDIAVDSLNNVYVVDKTNLRIQKFSPDGGFITMWGPQFDENNGFSKNINGIGVNPSNNNIYVVDTGNNRIVRFSADGVYLGKFGKPGTAPGTFRSPHDIAIDNNNNVYVTDTLNNRIQKLTITGNYIDQWGVPGTGNGQFNSPLGIHVGNNDDVFVVDNANSRIQKFTTNGDFAAKWGTAGAGPSQFKGHTFVTVGENNGVVYVSDTGNNRIQMFDTSCSKIIVNNYVVPTPDPTDFSFVSNFAPTFLLDHDTDPTLPNTASFLLPGSGGTYTLSQVPNSKYFTFLTCADPTTDTQTVGYDAIINLAPGETVTCNYRNTCIEPGGICFE